MRFCTLYKNYELKSFITLSIIQIVQTYVYFDHIIFELLPIVEHD